MKVNPQTGETQEAPKSEAAKAEEAKGAPTGATAANDTGVQPDTSVNDFGSQDDTPGAEPPSQLPGAAKRPYIQLAHGGVGFSAGTSFRAGDIVLNKEIFLAGPAVPPAKDATTVEMIVLRSTLYWKEYVSSARFNELQAKNEQAAAFTTEAAAQAAGFTTRYDEKTGQPPSAPPALLLDVLVKKPAFMEPNPAFCLNIGDDWWAPARLVLDKDHYRKNAGGFDNGARFAQNVGKPYGMLQALWTLGSMYGTLSRKPGATKHQILVMAYKGIMPRDQFEALYVQMSGAEGLAKLRKAHNVVEAELGSGNAQRALPAGTPAAEQQKSA